MEFQLGGELFCSLFLFLYLNCLSCRRMTNMAGATTVREETTTPSRVEEDRPRGAGEEEVVGTPGGVAGTRRGGGVGAGPTTATTRRAASVGMSALAEATPIWIKSGDFPGIPRSW